MCVCWWLAALSVILVVHHLVEVLYVNLVLRCVALAARQMRLEVIIVHVLLNLILMITQNDLLCWR